MGIFIEELILKIILWCLKTIDHLKEIMDGIFTKIPFFRNGEEINLINSFIENDIIKYSFWIIFILSIMIICISAIISLIKNIILNNQHVHVIMGKFLFSIISILVILAFFIISILITNELTNLVCEFLEYESHYVLSKEIFNLLVGKWNEGHSIIDFDINLIDRKILFGEYDEYINNIFPISFTNNGIVDYGEFNFILGFIASLCILISFIRILYLILKRIFKITFLYLMLPICTSTISLDDGQRLKKWKDDLIEEMFSFFLIFVAYNIISVMLPLILQIDFLNDDITKIFKIFIILVGYGIIPSYKNFLTLNNMVTKVKTKVVNNNSVSNVSSLNVCHRYVDEKL